jgi:sarcosine oxidase/L-pipecolate oxidase
MINYNYTINEEKLKVIQINLCTNVCATDTLQQYMKEADIDIALIQEPYLDSNSQVSLFPKNFQIIQSINVPKAAIVSKPKNNIKIMILENYTNDWIGWAIITFNNKDIYLCSVYMPPSQPISEIIDKLNSDLIEIKPENLVISGDTNAKNSLWFSSKNDKRGDDLIEFIVKNNLLVLNNSKTPTFVSPFGQSIIDITLTNSQTFDKIKNWKIEEKETNSDHSYIRYEIEFTGNTCTSTQTSYNSLENTGISDTVINQLNKKYATKKVDFNQFNELIKTELNEIKNEINNIHNNEKLEEIAEKLMNTIINKCDELIPKQKSFKNSNNWWTREISEKRKVVTRLRRSFRRTSEPNMRETRKISYYNEKKLYEKMIKKSKIESWRQFCHTSQTWGLPSKLMSNKLKIEKSIPNFVKSDGNYTKTPEESIAYAMEKLFPSDDIEPEGNFHKNIREYVEQIPETEDDIHLTANELKEVFNNLKPNKSPGWDQINNEIIKNIYETEPELLPKLFNKCLDLGYFPKIWKISIIKILEKSSDKSKHDIKNYRPISLLCIIAKILEKLIINRINHYLYRLTL